MTTVTPRPIDPMSDAQLELIVGARRGVLVTIGPDGLPRPVPFCYVAQAEEPGSLVLHSPIDEKPKRTDDSLGLARVRDIARRPDVVVLVDRWAEDWTQLAWVRLKGTAIVLPQGDTDTADERTDAVAALRAKYPQYATHALEERPIIRIEIDSWSGWSTSPAVSAAGSAPSPSAGGSGSWPSPGDSRRR